MKTGIIAWISMAKALHAAFTIARMMKNVNRIALANSKQKRMTARARYCRFIAEALIFFKSISEFLGELQSRMSM